MKVIEDNKNFILSDKNEHLNSFRQKIINRLKVVPFPNHKQESWRKINISDLQEISLQPKKFAIRFKKLEENRTVEFSDPSVKVISLYDRKGHFEFSYLESIYKTFENNYFALLNLLFFQAHVIQIPKNYKIKLIIEYEFSREENILYSPLLFFEIEKFSEVSFAEKINSNSANKLINQITYIKCDEESKVHYSIINTFSPKDVHINQYVTEQQKHSSFSCYAINFGGKKGKNFFTVNNNGEGSFTKILGLSYVRDREHNDIDMVIKHSKNHTKSSILYRALVDDQSHHIFTGNLKIPSSLKDIDSIQLNHNLLLNSKAKAESIPKLEVLSQDVMCEHGATVSEINEEMLFYLYSRGLNKSEAKRILIEGFFAKIIDEIPDSYFHTYIWGEIEKRIKT